MTDEISHCHLAAGDESRLPGEEPNGDHPAENYFDDPRYTEQRPERNRLAAEPAKKFLSAMCDKQ